MKEYTTETLKNENRLKCKDEILLSGVVYTARDAAHKKIMQLLDSGSKLPFCLNGAYIYYAGPTPTPTGKICGSFGPTTSCRMDGFTPRLYDLGLFATIGKGARNIETINAIKRNHAIYLLAIGGAGAIAAQHILSVQEIAFSELGCESIKRIEFEKFPLIVGIDRDGNDIFGKNIQ
ncbi:MAG: FumA C-terminus/TtdB family hydratase beta subunit [Clostridia bacterium]